jgi:hypothetical protein
MQKKSTTAEHHWSGASCSQAWIEHEIEASHFQDERLAKRFAQLLERISRGIGESIPASCQDWANTKAAYRFFSNQRVSEEEILAGPFQATAQRVSGVPGPILIVHDTSEFSYERGSSSGLGLISRPCTGQTPDGRLRHHTVRGI